MNSRPLDGRWLAAGLAVLYALLFWGAARTWGLEPTLQAAGVPSVGAPFSDLYVFSSATQEFAHGGNPYLSNPSDPWHRTYNYPRLWLRFMRFPFTAVPWLGLGIDAAWLIILWLWWGRLTPFQGLAAGAAACSPPVMLALERCNSDLIIFILVAGSLACLARDWRGAAWIGLLLSAVLKLFPIVAFAAFLSAAGKRAWPWVTAAAAGFIAWLLLHGSETSAVAHNTPTGGPAISYGSTVIFTIADLLHQQKTGQWAGYSALGWLGSLAAAFLGARLAAVGFQRKALAPVPGDRPLAGFQAGACIYLATFILGSNFAYRCIFLLLCLPWLLRKDSAFPWPKVRTAAGVVLLLCLWANPQWWLPLIALREAASWSLVGLLGCLVGATLLPVPLPPAHTGERI